MDISTPTISVVTVVKNAELTIADCIESVRRQTFPPLEHIIVDGLSSDKTLNIVNELAPKSAKILSEADSGIYDAMNKGLSMASGDIVGILNADDKYADTDVLETVAGVFSDQGVDACYGDLVYVDKYDTSRVVRYWASQPCADRLLYRGWMPPHPTFFVRRSAYERYGVFRTDLGSAADYELTLRFLLRFRIKAVYKPKLMVVMRTGGASNASIMNRIRVHSLAKEAWRVNDLKPKQWTMLFRVLDRLIQYFQSPR